MTLSDWQQFRDSLPIDHTVDIKETPLLSFPSGFALLSVTGDDRHDFLHGQLINDLNNIRDKGAQLSGWCNPKGQLISNFLVINTGVAYLLLFRHELKEYIQKRLTMFVLRSNVNIEDITDTTPLLGIANYSEPVLLDREINTEPGAVNAHDGVIMVCLPDNSQRYLLLGNIEAQIKQTSALLKPFALAASENWQLLDIEAGLPWISETTREKFLPQMLNLDTLQGLSYKKGCYPGQEVIARLHYRGEVKRRLHLITANTEITEGMTIKSGQDENVGTVVNAVKNGQDYSALAVIDNSKLQETLFVDSQATAKINLCH